MRTSLDDDLLRRSGALGGSTAQTPDAHPIARRPPKVGLVLGAGGPVGHAFHTAVVRALWDYFGWDVRDANVILGTSAGAQVGALIRAGLGPRDLLSRVLEEPLTPQGEHIARHYVRPSHPTYFDGRRRMTPASLGYLARIARRPWRARLGPFVAASLPEGRVDLRPQVLGFRALFGDDWPTQPLWIPAVDLDSGERVIFGRDATHSVDVGTAVASSGAVPGRCASITTGKGRFVDGGFASITHVDLMEEAQVDLVVVSSPLSRFGTLRRSLMRAVESLRGRGQRVAVFHPNREVRSIMGLNPMDTARAAAVARTAHASFLDWFQRASCASRQALHIFSKSHPRTNRSSTQSPALEDVLQA